MKEKMNVVKSLRGAKFACFSFLAVVLSVSARASDGNGTLGTWWWRGTDADNAEIYSERMDFLAANGVNEIYFCVHPKSAFRDVVGFVRAAGKRGMRVAWLAGDVSWIFPGNLGFDETWALYSGYQKKAPEDARFYALHLDVEPHQDSTLTQERRWQLYADLVMRVTSKVHRGGEKVEWDIPFWLDQFSVAYNSRTNAPLLEVVMDNSDCVTLMSYRDTAKAMLDTARGEIDLAASRKCRVVLGAETGQTGEGDFVSYFEEGRKAMKAELEIVRKDLSTRNLPAGYGVAVHHIGSWQKLKD